MRLCFYRMEFTFYRGMYVMGMPIFNFAVRDCDETGHVEKKQAGSGMPNGIMKLYLQWKWDQ